MPQDNGAVERANQDIKKGITNRVHELQSLCSTDEEKKAISWVTEHSFAAQSINTSSSQGHGISTPFELMFGAKFEDPMFESLRLRQSLSSTSLSTEYEELKQYLEDTARMRLQMLLCLGSDPDVITATAAASDQRRTTLCATGTRCADHQRYIFCDKEAPH